MRHHVGIVRTSVIRLKDTLIGLQTGRIEHWRRTSKRVVRQCDAHESGELAKLCRNSAREVVLVEKQLAESREPRETGVKRAGQLSR